MQEVKKELARLNGGSDFSYSYDIAKAFLCIGDAWKVKDISPLAGLQLKSLLFGNCPELEDISPIAGMPLETLIIRDCKKLSDISKLKGMNNLIDLALMNNKIKDLSPLAGKRFNSLFLLRLDITNDDVEIFKNSQIACLGISCTKITDLSFVKENKTLIGIDFYNTEVKDLSPLRGKRLESLKASNTKITDISVLEGMPLWGLFLDNNPQLTNLRPIENCKTLTYLSIPETAKDIEFLRKLPSLKRLDTKYDNNAEPDASMRTPEQFWKDYDAAKGKKK